MSSGDRKRQQRVLDTETNRQQQSLDQLKGTLSPMTNNMMSYYNRGAEQSFADYGDIMGRYRSYLDSPENFNFERISPERIDPSTISYTRSPELNRAMQGYGEFADTGGFDEAARRDIRARGTSPIRAAYGNTMMELNRARALGGDSGATNYIAAISRAQRELPQQLSDAQQAVEADLADKIQRGKLAGLGGLSETSLADLGYSQQANLANQDAIMRARLSNQDVSLRAALANQGAGLESGRNRLSALAGMGGMYSATPGLASTFGSQALNAAGNQLNAQQLQGDISRGRISGQQDISRMPTGFQSFLSNAGKIGSIAGAFAGIPFTGGASAAALPGMIRTSPIPLRTRNILAGLPSTIGGR